MKEPHLIGFSLSFCVTDILAGRVNIDDVFFIYTGTAARDEKDVQTVIRNYSETYWADYTHAEIKKVMDDLAGRIGYATRATVSNNLNINWGIWLSTKNAVRF